jgi:hypothetical protein
MPAEPIPLRSGHSESLVTIIGHTKDRYEPLLMPAQSAAVPSHTLTAKPLPRHDRYAEAG